MKDAFLAKIRNRNNNSISHTLPRLKFNSTIIKTSPNLELEKTINNYNYIPKINTHTIIKILKPKNIYKRNKHNKTIDMVHKLNLETNIKDIFLDELKKERKRDEINTSKEIIEKRLGKFKKIELDSYEEEKNKQTGLKYYNESSIDKLNIKEKEKNIEKNYKKGLKEIENMEKKLIEIDNNLMDLNDIIEGQKLEIKVLDNYGKSIDRKNIALEKPIQKKSKRKNSVITREKNNSEINNDRRSSLSKEKDFESKCKLLVKQYQRDEKEKQIKTEVDNNVKKFENLLKEKEDLKQKLNEAKIKINNLKNKLIDIYHSTLFEGSDFRGEGLPRIILNIWNLGTNVDMNFIPSYLDKLSVDFLFKKARQILEKSKIKKLIGKSEKAFIESLKKWKKDNKLHINSNKNIKNYFFKTKINETKDISFLDYYPKTKLFMSNYKLKNENHFEENEYIKFDKSLLKNWDIPKNLIEQNKKLEEAKNLQKTFKNQNDLEDKKEVSRLCKEFLFNDYEEKYKVCIETMIGALFGEMRKDDMLNFYYGLKKEKKDNLKKIEFYFPLSERKRK